VVSIATIILHEPGALDPVRSRLPTLWSRSYYAGTVGHVRESTVRAYKAQKAP
jgi:REP element-mobilizing transposase RayT